MRNVLVFGLFCSLFVSCKKDLSSVLTDAERDQTVATDNSLVESYSDDIAVISDEAYNNNALVTRSGSSSGSLLADTVKITRNNSDSSITIDFGSVGIVGRDGRVRKGQIIIKFANGYRKVGASVSQTFNNYAVDGRQMTGTLTVTYKGLDSLDRPYWMIVANLTVTKSSGKVITWNSTRSRVMSEGYSTPLNWTDDEYLISGSASGFTSNGDSYSLIIGKSLRVKVGCRFIIDGTIEYLRGTRNTLIDYGYGGVATCDGQALVTLPSGITVVVNL
ncbi:MAG: hypothetical protein ACOVP5_00725 [Chitinophagales bacterium]